MKEGLLCLGGGLYLPGDGEWRQFLSAAFSTLETSTGRGGGCLCGVLFSLIEMPSDSLLGKVMETPTTHDLSGAMP